MHLRSTTNESFLSEHSGHPISTYLKDARGLVNSSKGSRVTSATLRALRDSAPDGHGSRNEAARYKASHDFLKTHFMTMNELVLVRMTFPREVEIETKRLTNEEGWICPWTNADEKTKTEVNAGLSMDALILLTEGQETHQAELE